MSRKIALLAAVAAFCGLSSVAMAQGGQGSGGTDQSAQITAPMAGSGSSMRSRPMRAQRPMRHSNRTAMRGTGRAGMARGTDMGARSPNANAAYMGGGAVYERAADGSLRPVM